MTSPLKSCDIKCHVVYSTVQSNPAICPYSFFIFLYCELCDVGEVKSSVRCEVSLLQSRFAPLEEATVGPHLFWIAQGRLQLLSYFGFFYIHRLNSGSTQSCGVVTRNTLAESLSSAILNILFLPVFTLPVFSFASQYQYWLCQSCSHRKGLGTTLCKKQYCEHWELIPNTVSFKVSMEHCCSGELHCTNSHPVTPSGCILPAMTPTVRLLFKLMRSPPPCILCHACDIVPLVMAEEYWWFCSCDTTHPAL